MNKMQDCVAKIGAEIQLPSPPITVIWDDMVNPLHTGGRENQQLKFGGKYGSTAPALGLIHKSIRALSWAYADNEAGDHYIFKNGGPPFFTRFSPFLARFHRLEKT